MTGKIAEIIAEIKASLDRIEAMLEEMTGKKPATEQKTETAPQDRAEAARAEAAVHAARLEQWLAAMKPRVEKTCSRIDKEYLQRMLDGGCWIQCDWQDYIEAWKDWGRRRFLVRLEQMTRGAEEAIGLAEAWLAEGEKGNPEPFCWRSAKALHCVQEIESLVRCIAAQARTGRESEAQEQAVRELAALADRAAAKHCDWQYAREHRGIVRREAPKRKALLDKAIEELRQACCRLAEQSGRSMRALLLDAASRAVQGGRDFYSVRAAKKF